MMEGCPFLLILYRGEEEDAPQNWRKGRKKDILRSFNPLTASPSPCIQLQMRRKGNEMSGNERRRRWVLTNDSLGCTFVFLFIPYSRFVFDHLRTTLLYRFNFLPRSYSLLPFISCLFLVRAELPLPSLLLANDASFRLCWTTAQERSKMRVGRGNRHWRELKREIGKEIKDGGRNQRREKNVWGSNCNLF